MSDLSAAEYLRAAAEKLRECAYLDGTGHYSRGASTLEVAVADWLDVTAELVTDYGTDATPVPIRFRYALAVAAAVLGRTWPS